MTMTHRGGFTEDHSAEIVIDSLGAEHRSAAAGDSDRPDPAPARLRQGRPAHRGRMGGQGIEFLTRTGADLHRRPPGIHPALRRPRGVDAGRDDQPPRPRSRHRTNRPGTRSTWSTRRTRELGDTIALDGAGEPCLVTGRVTNADGSPLAGASVDVWQANAEGFYDVQQPDIQPERNLRGLFTTDDDGQFWFRSHRAAVLPDPRRRAGRGPPGAHRPPSQPAGARALHRHRARPRNRSPPTCSSTAPPTSTPMSCSGSRRA